MVNELCELAASGISTRTVILIGIALALCGAVGYTLHKKNKLNTKWLLPVLVLLLSIISPISQPVFAQSASQCNTGGNGAQGGNNLISTPVSPSALGGLVNDNPVLTANFDLDDDPPTFYGFSANFQILNNDNAPDGDPFDVSTLQLLGNYPDPNPGAINSFLILDPNNPIPPSSPGWPGNPGWENVWGYWSLEMTCDINDLLNCVDNGPGPEVEPYCISVDWSGCWPSGNVDLSFNSDAQPGVYSIQYTVNTQSGISLIPATITATVPEPPEPPVPSPILAGSDILFQAECDNWPVGLFTVDLMDYVSTTGTGTLLPGTIDLIPSTPEIDTTVTIYNPSFPANFATLVVDSNGIVTMTPPTGGFPGYDNNYTFRFTIRDSDDFLSNEGEITLSFACG
jgi:hypothetical protein